VVAAFFEQLRVPIVDTDVIARDLVERGSPALEQIRQAFGDDVIDHEGSLDRGAMRRLIFADPARRKQLEVILHPLIRVAAFAQASEAKGPYVIIVVPLLFESPMKSAVDRILVVDCNEETQVQRLKDRDRESNAQARRIIAAQASRADRLSIADDVITNEGDRDQTRDAVRTLHEMYLKLANQK
jgi:dephospho-CoA kinase